MDHKLNGEFLFSLYTSGVGGTTHDGQVLTYGMLGERQRKGWDVAANIFAQEIQRCHSGVADPSQAVLDACRVMVEKQASLNSTAYSTAWMEKGSSGEWDYRQAASAEISEFVKSVWLPWWSKTEVDLANARIEIVDALHFMLSEHIIVCGGDTDHVAHYIAYHYMSAQEDWAVLKAVAPQTPKQIAKELQVVLNMDRGNDLDDDIGFQALFRLCMSIDFSFDQLTALYLAKSVLNQFRKDNGYKEGKYIKLWDGKHEDNYFMSKWVGECQTPPTEAEVYDWLVVQYREHGAAASKAKQS